MIKKIKTLFLTLAMAGSLLVPAVVPAVAHAADPPSIRAGLEKGTCLSATQSGCEEQVNAEDKINTIIKTIIDIFSLVVGVVSVIMIIVGGLKYITSAGDSNNITSAKNTIMYALIGLAVVALAQFLVQFVLKQVNQ